jgi:hypothetical protein
MIVRRPADERGKTHLSWLDSRHSFSFGDYYDPAHMGFRKLRVINDDRVAAGGGFGTHSHRDMEIVTYIVDGALEHKDSLGNGSIIRPGDAQRMSAGTGISHSEINHSHQDAVHLLQIWILPERSGLAPGYEQRAIPSDEMRGRLRRIASRDGADGGVVVHQDCEIYATRLTPGDRVRHVLVAGRHAWVQVARGDVTLNGLTLGAGDGAAVSNEAALEIGTNNGGEVLVFDLA